MAKRTGLLPGEFLVRLPKDAEVVLNGHKQAHSYRLLVDTPTAAEIIRVIAELDAFKAYGDEKFQLRSLATKIAARFSGH